MAQQAMRTMDVAHLANRSVTDLSGGERQQAVIARALTQTPKVLLLDEPTAFLDLQHQLGICSILRALNEERGLTIVMVSHDLNLASQHCDRILMLKDGVVAKMGSPVDVMLPEICRRVWVSRIGRLILSRGFLASRCRDNCTELNVHYAGVLRARPIRIR